MDAAAPTVLSELDGIFAFEELKTPGESLLSGKGVFALLLTSFGKDVRGSSLQGSDICLMPPLAPIRSLEFRLNRKNNKICF